MATSSEPTYRLRIHDMPDVERPRERLKHYGASALSNAELLAILLRTGVQGENVLTLRAKDCLNVVFLTGCLLRNATFI